MGLKIVSVNIERENHLDKIMAFLAREEADVVCLMEIREVDIPILAGAVYPYCLYAPNNVIQNPQSERATLGVALLSKTPLLKEDVFYADGKTPETLAVQGKGTHSPVVLLAQVGKFRLGVVHFTWTEGGSVSPAQRQHVHALIQYLALHTPFVLSGDFNIPRGNEMYRLLLEHYRDNIPPEIMSTIDPDLHRANSEERGKLAFMVDYIWTTPEYLVSGVKVVNGVSDHAGLVYLLDLADRV